MTAASIPLIAIALIAAVIGARALLSTPEIIGRNEAVKRMLRRDVR